MNMNIFFRRIIRAAKLDYNLYEEAKKDIKLLPQAAAVVILSIVATVIGSFSKIGKEGILGGIFFGIIIGLIIWYILAMFTYLIGTKLFPESRTKSNLGELLRTIGFSNAPGLICVFGVIGTLQRLVFSLAAAWMLVAMVIAVKCALNYESIWRAAGVCLIVQVILLALFFLLSGGQKPL